MATNDPHKDWKPVKTFKGRGPDGMPIYEYDHSQHPGMQGDDISAHSHLIVLTGPIAGPITLADGSTCDVTDEYIAVHKDDANELLHRIHQVQHASGKTPVEPPAEPHDLVGQVHAELAAVRGQ